MPAPARFPTRPPPLVLLWDLDDATYDPAERERVITFARSLGFDVQYDPDPGPLPLCPICG